MLCLCTSLVMQAVHEEVYSSAWTKTPESWCNVVLQLCIMLVMVESPSIVTSPKVVFLHLPLVMQAIHQETYSAA
jgi:hypothetical protein